MTHALTPCEAPLSDALYEFSLAKHFPDAELLDQFVRRFPQHADALVDFAIEIVMDALAGPSNDSVADEVIEPGKVSPIVSRVMSRFYNRLYEVKKSAVEEQAPSAAEAQSAHKSNIVHIKNPFADLRREQFRKLALSIGVNSVFMVKLRDHQIEFRTIPMSFQQRVADGIGVPTEVVVAYLKETGAPVSSRQFYKADGKPKTGSKQSFHEAVRSSGLDEDKQQYLLNL